MRLIDADAFKAHMAIALNDSIPEFRSQEGVAMAQYVTKEFMRDIDERPTVDAVEVVRCKDCKHFTEGMAIGMCKRIPDRPILPMPYNNYCGFAERRDDNGMV